VTTPKLAVVTVRIIYPSLPADGRRTFFLPVIDAALPAV